MAKYHVKKYTSNIIDIGDDHHSLLIICVLENARKKINTHCYKIFNDTNEPDLLVIKNTIDNGFSEAINENKSIEISLYKERMYINMILPDKENKKQEHKFTGIVVKEIKDLINEGISHCKFL